MAKLLEHFTFALVLFALTTGLWYGGEGRTCVTPIGFASCEKDRPSTCVNICRSGLYFPTYLLISSFCEERYNYNHYGYYCKCIWECDDFSAATIANARPPVSVVQPPIVQ